MAKFLIAILMIASVVLNLFASPTGQTKWPLIFILFSCYLGISYRLYMLTSKAGKTRLEKIEIGIYCSSILIFVVFAFSNLIKLT